MNIRKIYLYVATLLGLILIVIGGVRLVNLGLKSFVFTEADNHYTYPRPKPVSPNSTSTVETEPNEEELQEYNENQERSERQRNAAESIAFIVIGLPVYMYHWKKVQKEDL